MVATFNGWDEMPEGEREALDLWEQAQRSMADGTRPYRRSGSTRGSRVKLQTGGFE
jgi:hypothetical protein